ncbi:hypothetical protein COCMIDRAFT_28483 [Bipolaris oryzae ATCC 44560]|uniref:F-box domain-containing protein n=1 Tax=Bipolaris oryzae ATCC 44560 TaxID=930090 RepID=W6YZD8_COCMI|nr:uncharacterized protein COCMIDRAFT_28483 [Bipolaris oryzae ATCC 44560]EUC42975.1 hypothetical protein COCMIDRAFT_28483 [Bipolaris oryzae ATCC 44560]
MHRALTLPEVLLSVISYLPIRDLLICHAVSSGWRRILVANLPARMRPLPDTPSAPLRETTLVLPDSIRSLARSLNLRPKELINWIIQPEIETDYLIWRNAATDELQEALGPYMHPLLVAHTYDLTGGIEDVARGQMGISIRTKMGLGEFERMLEIKNDEEEGMKYLTQPVTKSVEVRCLDGAEWDEEYRNVRTTAGDMEWLRRCVRVERESGVRMCDVVDELRGVIEAEWSVQQGSGNVLLDWRMGDCPERHLFHAFDLTG